MFLKVVNFIDPCARGGGFFSRALLVPCAARSRAHVIASLSALSYERWYALAKNKKRESDYQNN
jgi:hypothetical protein